jgi:NADH:ubiquinone oxidoreductase subunit 6 (subunit J)
MENFGLRWCLNNYPWLAYSITIIYGVAGGIIGHYASKYIDDNNDKCSAVLFVIFFLFMLSAWFILQGFSLLFSDLGIVIKLIVFVLAVVSIFLFSCFILIRNDEGLDGFCLVNGNFISKCILIFLMSCIIMVAHASLIPYSCNNLSLEEKIIYCLLKDKIEEAENLIGKNEINLPDKTAAFLAYKKKDWENLESIAVNNFFGEEKEIIMALALYERERYEEISDISKYDQFADFAIYSLYKANKLTEEKFEILKPNLKIFSETEKDVLRLALGMDDGNHMKERANRVIDQVMEQNNTGFLRVCQ